MNVENFNIRVYGILEGSNGSVLLTDENRFGVEMTKFVGGGVEKGEGLADALKREFIEEMDLKIEIESLFYINDFLQISAFNPKDQLFSIYYKVSTHDWKRVEECINHPSTKQSFKWVNIHTLSKNDVTFPIDKVVVERLLEGN